MESVKRDLEFDSDSEFDEFAKNRKIMDDIEDLSQLRGLDKSPEKMDIGKGLAATSPSENQVLNFAKLNSKIITEFVNLGNAPKRSGKWEVPEVILSKCAANLFGDSHRRETIDLENGLQLSSTYAKGEQRLCIKRFSGGQCNETISLTARNYVMVLHQKQEILDAIKAVKNDRDRLVKKRVIFIGGGRGVEIVKTDKSDVITVGFHQYWYKDDPKYKKYIFGKSFAWGIRMSEAEFYSFIQREEGIKNLNAALNINNVQLCFDVKTASSCNSKECQFCNDLFKLK